MNAVRRHPMMIKTSLSLVAAALFALTAVAHAADGNALLVPSPLALHYPQFDKIRDSDFPAAFQRGMREHLAEVQAIAKQGDAPTFDNTILALERSGQLLARTNLLFYNLLGADANPQRQKLDEDFSPRFAAHADAIHLNPRLFARVDSLYQRRGELGLDAVSLRLLERYERDMLRAGARLSDAQKTHMKAINAELAKLASQFTRSVLAEVDASAVVVDTVADLDGLSPTEIATTASAAKDRKLDGKYLIALLNTTDQPMLAELKNRALRERLYKASITRGSRGGAHDSTGIVARTLALRAEKARLLGFASFADFALEDETAKTIGAVNGILRQVAIPAVATARREGAELQAVIDQEQAAAKQPGFKLQAWDWAYYSEHLRASRYGFDASQLKPYFEMKNVLENGVFYAANQLYGLTFKQRADLPVYQPDVVTYDVLDADGSQLGIFMADMYARPNKNGGAWMSNYVNQSGLFDEKAVVVIHLNIPKPDAGQPTLLTWDEVTTAFHETGHGLHGLFSKVRYPTLAGTNVPNDFVEYPSQVNEMWADWPEVLGHYAKHWQTGEPMPRELLDKVLAAKTFNQGFQTTAYVSAAVLDQRWHQLPAAQLPAAGQVMAGEARLLKEAGFDYAAVPPRYRTPYFSHFMGDYAAGYYAYLWAEVLDSNTVEWFKANGGLQRSNGDTFRAKLLSRGDSEDPLAQFRNVVGHEPEIEPLLARRGMLDKPQKAASP